MWTQAKSNRIIYEREKVKDHVMHMERLRSIKPTIQISRPKKPSHLKTNAKREMQNLGKSLRQLRSTVIKRSEHFWALRWCNRRGLGLLARQME